MGRAETVGRLLNIISWGIVPLVLCASGAWAAQAPTQRIETLTEQAARGDAKAQANLGMAFHIAQGVPQDDAQAAFWWRKAAEQGDADAQTNLGFAYGTGQGVPQDYVQSALWWHKAADQGYAPAQTENRRS